MKLITRLEKSKTFWSLLWISVLFFILRLPSLIEPNWYGDEGIYQVMGTAMNNGSLLYRDIWDNKPPLLYLLYALFQGDQFTARLASLVVGLITIWVFFSLARKLFEKTKVSIMATTIFAVLFALPFIEGNIANAENFMLLPIILAGIFIYKISLSKEQKIKPLFFAGLLLGIAFLLKIVAVFDLAAFITFLFFLNFPLKIAGKSKWSIDRAKLKMCFRHSLPVVLGFVIPLAITLCYFILNNALLDFFRATLFGNVGYVGYGNQWLIPQGLLIVKLIALAAFLIVLAIKRANFSQASLFILIWTAFAIFNATFSQRPYTHYVLVLLPSFCLFLGLVVAEEKAKMKKLFIVLLLLILGITIVSFKFYSFKKTFLYYQNAILFVTGKKDVKSYQSFFDWKTPRDYELSSYLKMRLKPYEHVLVWGDSAQIYVLSQTLPINKYTVAYHTTQSKDAIVKTQIALNKLKPKYVIILPEARVFPFRITDYIAKFSVSRATVYERSF